MQATLEAQLAHLPATEANGTALYSFLFTKAPEVKTFFKGDESIDPSAIPASPRFKKLGVEFLQRLASLVSCCDDDAAFKQAVHEMAVSHKNNHGVGVDQFKLIPQIFLDFVATQGLTADPAWHDFWKKFLDNAAL